MIRGVDLRHIDDSTAQAIREVWAARKVVFFPDQHLDPDAHLAVAEKFGEPTEGHLIIPGIAGYPKIFEMDHQMPRAT